MRPRSVRDVEWSNVWNVLILAVMVGGGIWFMLRNAERPGLLSPGVAECQHAYTRAKTPADTAAVDLMHPSTGPQKDPNAPSCGTLRRIGRVR